MVSTALINVLSFPRSFLPFLGLNTCNMAESLPDLKGVFLASCLQHRAYTRDLGDMALFDFPSPLLILSPSQTQCLLKH